MVPERILAKMRVSAGGAGLALLLSGCGQSQPAAPMSAKPSTISPSPTVAQNPDAAPAKPIPNTIDVVEPQKCVAPALTDDDMKTYTEALGHLGDSNEAQVQAAMKQIEYLGSGVSPLLTKEMANIKTPPEVKQKIAQIINRLEFHRDPCPGCGMG
jgi:hypothetical protein